MRNAEFSVKTQLISLKLDTKCDLPVRAAEIFLGVKLEGKYGYKRLKFNGQNCEFSVKIQFFRQSYSVNAWGDLIQIFHTHCYGYSTPGENP